MVKKAATPITAREGLSQDQLNIPGPRAPTLNPGKLRTLRQDVDFLVDIQRRVCETLVDGRDVEVKLVDLINELVVFRGA